MAPQPSAAAADQNEQDDQVQGDDSQAGAQPDAMPGEGRGEPGSDTAALDQGQEPPLPGAGEEGPEQEEWALVVAGTADMRSEPDLRSPMIYALPSGWHVRVISRQPGWVQVQDANSGAAGWVESSALAPSDGPGARPGYGQATGKAMAALMDRRRATPMRVPIPGRRRAAAPASSAISSAGRSAASKPSL